MKVKRQVCHLPHLHPPPAFHIVQPFMLPAFYTCNLYFCLISLSLLYFHIHLHCLWHLEQAFIKTGGHRLLAAATAARMAALHVQYSAPLVLLSMVRCVSVFLMEINYLLKSCTVGPSQNLFPWFLGTFLPLTL